MDPINVPESARARHLRERELFGASRRDFWNGDVYLAWVIAGVLDWHIGNRTGYPARKTDEQWNQELVDAHKAFSAYSQDPDEVDIDGALRWLADNFRDLWD